jgi:AraC family transcriptional regulator
MPPPSEGGSTGDLPAGTTPNWLGQSLWQAPKIEISRTKTWHAITAVSYRRDAGEAVWRGERHRIVLIMDPHPPSIIQVEKGPVRQLPLLEPGVLSFFPAGLTLRTVQSAARHVQVVWDPDLYSTLLPELGAATSAFEFVCPLQDPLLGPIVTTLNHEIEVGVADKILVESLGTALCIRLARRFLGRLPLPVSGGLSPDRLQRVRDYVEEHLDDDLSLTMLADVACLSPYHFSRSFKQATGIGPQRYVIQRRLERAKRLLRLTRQPLAMIAQEVGFADQSHLNAIFRREMGVTPGRFRAAIA